METIKVHLKNKIVELKVNDFDWEIDTDKLTSIQYDNLYGEIVTVSTLFNRIGILKAEIDNEFARKKLDFDIYEAQTRKTKRTNAVSNNEKMTVQQLDDEVTLDKGWQQKKKEVITLQKDCAYIDSIYWAIQSKDKKLSILLKGVTPEEFENNISEGVINGIFIKKHDKKY